MFLFCSSAIRPFGHAAIFMLFYTSLANAQPHEPLGGEAQRVVVRVVNGRVYEGALGVSQQAHEMVLENRSGGITATTVIPLSNVVSVTPAASGSVTVPSAIAPVERPQLKRRADVTRKMRQPQWIEAAARLVNHDADAEADGIEVRVVGLTASGVVPLRGSVDIHLEGLFKPRPDVRARLKTIERWTMPIESRQPQAGDTVWQLPFRGAPPCDWRLYEWARVRVRLNTPSVGSWDAQTPVALHSLDPFHAELLRQQTLWKIGHGSQPIR